MLEAPASEQDLTAIERPTWWRQVLEVVDGALEVPGDERVAYVARACVGAPELAAAATDVLDNGDAVSFLDVPATEFAMSLVVDVSPHIGAPFVGTQLGSYRILHELGRGGMGTVYLAERADDQYDKHVALKLLPGWSAGNERLIRRFREERQILAGLEHPNIARLFDGGVTHDGRPWFAMEYVEGAPIDRFCDERRLPFERRLELFCRVCAAVQYAHRNLVVHRDLKPANILVTADEEVKLLDFGIAKLLASDAITAPASLTLTAERFMTPRYASPEQVRGGTISTASDVYSLGVLLYELLTGRFPYRLTTQEPHEIAAAILGQEPERPSAAVSRPPGAGVRNATESPDDAAMARGITVPKLARRLRGDLDTIVLTAMHKDPARRYGTAERLEADVRRHLAGLPLTARPESGLARARKFVRRHRLGVAVAAGVLLLVLASGIVTAVQTMRIRTQAASIAAERDRTAQAYGFLAGLFQASDPFTNAGGARTAREILDGGAATIERELGDQPERKAQMLSELGRAYFRSGVRDRGRSLLETSLAIQRRTEGVSQLDMARTLDFVGVARLEQGELRGAELAHREALVLRQRLLGARHRDVARTLNGLAAVCRAAGRFRDADLLSREAVAIDEAQGDVNRLELAESLKGLAEAVHQIGNRADAVRLYQQVLSLQRQDLAVGHPEALSTLLDLATSLGEAGDIGGADTLFRQGLALERQVLGGDHPRVARDEARYAQLLHRRGDLAASEGLYDRSLATARHRLPAVHPLTATILLGLGAVLLDRGGVDQAEALVREALAIRTTTLPIGHPDVAEAEQAMGAAVMAGGRYVEAEDYLFSSRDALRAAYGDADPRALEALARLVRLYEISGQPDRASTYRNELVGPRR